MGLNTSAVYGVRRYLRGGFMAAHTDHESKKEIQYECSIYGTMQNY